MEYLKPFKKIKDFNNLTLELPLSLYIIFVLIKFCCSNKMNLLYLLLLIALPLFAYILIHKIIAEKYFQMELIRQNYILYYDFFKIFFAGYTPFVLFRLLLLILRIKSRTGYINFLIILYTVYIGGKLFSKYFLSQTIINKQNIQYYKPMIKKDKKIEYFIFLIIYYLISHILIHK